MGARKYRRADPPNVQGICCRCGLQPQRPTGEGKFKTICRRCDRELHPWKRDRERLLELQARKIPRPTWRKHKGDTCERCGFIPEHTCQLDVDHRDGDKKNGNPDNLQTLCANCHRLKTAISREHINLRYRGD